VCISFEMPRRLVATAPKTTKPSAGVGDRHAEAGRAAFALRRRSESAKGARGPNRRRPSEFDQALPTIKPDAEGRRRWRPGWREPSMA